MLLISSTVNTYHCHLQSQHTDITATLLDMKTWTKQCVLITQKWVKPGQAQEQQYPFLHLGHKFSPLCAHSEILGPIRETN